MLRNLRLSVAVASALGLAATLLPGPATAAQPDEHSPNMTLVGTSPFTSFTNSDLAFWGDRMYAGNYGGFRILDISDPTNPTVVTDFPCGSVQGDISVWNNDGDPEADLLFLSVDGPRASTTCGASTTPSSNPAGFEGVRVFDINNEAVPVQIAAVPTDCGSHTHTLIPGPPADNAVYLYVSSYPISGGSVTSGIQARDNVSPGPDFSAGMKDDGTVCLEPEPIDPGAGVYASGTHDKISIIKVDLSDPASADDRVPGPDPDGPGPLDPVGWTYTNIKEQGLPIGGDPVHFQFGGRMFSFTACHDISAFMPRNRAVGACFKEGIWWNIADPWNPDFLRRVRRPDLVDLLYHTATFSWDGKIVALEDEAGGGGDDRCHLEDGEPDEQGAIYFHKMNARFLGIFKIPRDIPGTCTAHNFNPIPAQDGTYMMASAWYQGGTSMFDFTDPTNAHEVGYYVAKSPQANTWSSYWYNGYVYANDIPRGVDVFRFDDPSTTTAVTLSHLNPQTMEVLIPQTISSPSKVTIRKGSFRGRVLSERDDCVPGRKVLVKKKRRGPDRTVARDTTDARGRWAARVRGASGRYYALVKQRTFMDAPNTIVCEAAKSRTIRV